MSAFASATAVPLDASTADDGTLGRRISPWLSFTHYAYPVILLFFFLAVFTYHSVKTAEDPNGSPDAEQLTGPGGKPLPKSAGVRRRRNKAKEDIPRTQKLLFEWLSVLAALSFVGNAANVILHALVDRDEGYWCGQAYVVRSFLSGR